MFGKCALRAGAAGTVLAVSVLVPHLVFAQDSSWVGQKVVTKYDYPVKIGDQPVEKQYLFHVYTVTRVNGDWLWVVSGSIEGWLPTSQALLFDQATDFYAQEIRANPGNRRARLGRILILLEMKQYDEAIGDLSEVIRLDPTSNSYTLRGMAWGRNKQYDKSIEDLNEAILLDPTNATAHFFLANAWKANKEYENAFAYYSETIRLNPNLSAAYNMLAWIRATCPDDNLRDGEKAVELALAACKLTDRKDPDMLDTLAAAYAEAADFNKAVECQEEANKLLTDESARSEGLERLHLYTENKPYRDTRTVSVTPLSSAVFSREPIPEIAWAAPVVTPPSSTTVPREPISQTTSAAPSPAPVPERNRRTNTFGAAPYAPAQGGGIILAQSNPGTPAAGVMGGLEYGDVILGINGKPVNTIEEYFEAVWRSPDYMKFTFRNVRDGVVYEAAVWLAR